MLAIFWRCTEDWCFKLLPGDGDSPPNGPRLVINTIQFFQEGSWGNLGRPFVPRLRRPPRGRNSAALRSLQTEQTGEPSESRAPRSVKTIALLIWQWGTRNAWLECRDSIKQLGWKAPEVETVTGRGDVDTRPSAAFVALFTRLVSSAEVSPFSSALQVLLRHLGNGVSVPPGPQTRQIIAGRWSDNAAPGFPPLHANVSIRFQQHVRDDSDHPGTSHGCATS